MLRLIGSIFVFLLTCAATHASVLDEILKEKELRVGTTGDYAPFSLKKKNFSGLDIDMAKSLGKSLGVKVKFVQTSWKNLMKNLHEENFHIGMSGVSITLDRQKTAFFSTPYWRGGKAAISRCADRTKFKKLDTIDQPSVRLIVNPGGTNDRFVKENIKKAIVIRFSDNTKIFDEIVAKRADVMITDAVETLVQAKKHESLCAVNPDDPFSFSEMGYLLPRGDVAWQAYVNQWLHRSLNDGSFKKLRMQWIGR